MPTAATTFSITTCRKSTRTAHARWGYTARRGDWEAARDAAKIKSDHSADMHGRELEASILLSEHPEMVKPSYRDAGFSAPERLNLQVLGMTGYTSSGIMGFPSEATAQKGRLGFDSLISSFSGYLELFQEDSPKV
ncbi:creatininase family protein [Natronoglycomyces albus]|uniref:Creatininase family protein n=1 Tax=Natronoglycomyces albus TaxID=2811108 RepID=A0A895XSM1_9ACTN|nr:creatininase family protein [Natronoglycomyces albus]QSB06662.1 creatininase family protein [Natronoglycomyces albus]